jgi:putative peptidoglycan lipid II flippase
MTLVAYASGLVPFVLTRSAAVTFLARGDTVTPIKALGVAVVVNVALKVALMDRYAQVGLAIATSVGAWINLALLVWFAIRQKILVIDARLRRSTGKIVLAGIALAAALYLCERLFAGWFAKLPSFRDEATLLALMAVGAIVYGGAVLLLFGRQLRALAGNRSRAATPPAPEHE